MVKFQAIKFRLMDTIILRDESPTAAKFVPGFLAKGVLAYFTLHICVYFLCRFFEMVGHTIPSRTIRGGDFAKFPV